MTDQTVAFHAFIIGKAHVSSAKTLVPTYCDHRAFAIPQLNIYLFFLGVNVNYKY